MVAADNRHSNAADPLAATGPPIAGNNIVDAAIYCKNRKRLSIRHRLSTRICSLSGRHPLERHPLVTRYAAVGGPLVRFAVATLVRSRDR